MTTTDTWQSISRERRIAREILGEVHAAEDYASEALRYARRAFSKRHDSDSLISDFLCVWVSYSASRISRGAEFSSKSVRRLCLRDARRQTWRLRLSASGLSVDTREPLKRLPAYIDCLDSQPLKDLADEHDGFPSPTLWARERGKVRRVSRLVSQSSILVDGDGFFNGHPGVVADQESSILVDGYGIIQAISYGRRGY